jgi:D-alanyl-D-alanine carboxypeptidase
MLGLALVALVGVGGPSECELQRAANRLIARTEIPAVITLVEQDGRRTVVAAGEADLARHRPARPGDRFWVGSVTKSFVATVVMQLVAERKLRLEDTLAQRLPGRFRDGRRIRLRHLLNHTSGIPDYMRLEPWGSAVARNPRVVIPARRLVSSAASEPLECAPGSQASYSNTNYLVLGEVLDRVTGRPVAELLRERILEPLGLTATTFEPPNRALGADQMHGYDITGTRPRDVSLQRLGGPWADGAIVSNARATWRSSSAHCCAGSSCRPPSWPRCGRSFHARTAAGWASSSSAHPAAAGSTATRAARRVTSPSPPARATAAAST